MRNKELKTEIDIFEAEDFEPITFETQMLIKSNVNYKPKWARVLAFDIRG